MSVGVCNCAEDGRRIAAGYKRDGWKRRDKSGYCASDRPRNYGGLAAADCLLTYANGKTQRPWASSASGYLIYSPNGHMCKSLNYPTPSGQIDCISYCGHYEIFFDRVFHSIAVSANIREVGTVL